MKKMGKGEGLAVAMVVIVHRSSSNTTARCPPWVGFAMTRSILPLKRWIVC